MSAGWADARRILAVRLDAAGDVLMTTPALRALKEAAPGRHLTLLTSPSGVAAADLVPEVDEVIEYVAPWMKPAAPPDPAAHLAMAERLRAGRFDAAVVFTVYSQNPLPAALLAYLAGIPLRLAHCRENPYGLLTDWVRESEPEGEVRHEVRRQLDLVAAVGTRPADERMGLALPPGAADRVRGLLEGAVDRVRPWAVMHVGASAESRRYPPSAFAQVARTLAEEHGWQVVFTGGREERALVEAVRDEAAVPSLSLAGELDLGELSALVAEAPLLISNNTGPAHLAAAVGTPVVDLYALTNPQHAPWMVPHRLLYHPAPCGPCYRSVCPEGHHACLELVPARAVVDAALDLVTRERGPDAEGIAARPALLLDSDGVLFDTEGHHLASLLRTLDAARGEVAVPPEGEVVRAYLQHARGRDRYEGMEALLATLGIELPRGEHSDLPGVATVCALANLKNQVYGELVASEGVPLMRGARDLVQAARDRGFAIAVVSSSRHARGLIVRAGLEPLVEAIVAPTEVAGLHPKPHPDPYRRAMELLRVRPEDCVAVEDAPSGVRSAVAAGAGRVVGLAMGGAVGLVVGRGGPEGGADLVESGAHEVVDGLGRLGLLLRPVGA